MDGSLLNFHLPPCLYLSRTLINLKLVPPPGKNNHQESKRVRDEDRGERLMDVGRCKKGLCLPLLLHKESPGGF